MTWGFQWLSLFFLRDLWDHAHAHALNVPVDLEGPSLLWTEEELGCLWCDGREGLIAALDGMKSLAVSTGR
jgi:hypothetical protein